MAICAGVRPSQPSSARISRSLAQASERGGDWCEVAGGFEQAVGDDDLGCEPVCQGGSSALTPTPVGQHSTRDPVEPKTCLITGWDVVETPPGDQERVRDRVGRVLGVIRSSQHVAKNRAVAVAVERFEALPALLGPVHRRASFVSVHASQMSATDPSISWRPSPAQLGHQALGPVRSAHHVRRVSAVIASRPLRADSRLMDTQHHGDRGVRKRSTSGRMAT